MNLWKYGTERTATKGKREKRQRGERVDRVCKHCRAVFKFQASRMVKPGRGSFCSLRCRMDYPRPAKQKRLIAPDRANGCGHDAYTESCGHCRRKALTRLPKTCPECQRRFWPNRHSKGITKFCGAACYFASNRRKGFETITCLNCGGTARRRVVRTRPRKIGAFCNSKCAGAYLRGENNPLYRGPKDPNRGPDWRRLAEQMRERDGFCCRRCGKTQAENGQKLSVDHITPWRAFNDKAEANHPSNLVSLCRSCHQKKTSTAERQWLRGDVMGMQAYRRAVGA